MKKPRDMLRIQCARCPTRLVCSAGTKAEFAAALEERGWRALKGGSAGRAVCPKCAKATPEKELSPPRTTAAGAS